MKLKGCDYNNEGMYVCTYSAFEGESFGDLNPSEIHKLNEPNSSSTKVEINVC